MAELIDLASVPGVPLSAGVRRSVLVDASRCRSTEFVAELFRISPAGELQLESPAGSDRYLFVLSGIVQLTGETFDVALGPRTFVSLAEGQRSSLRGTAQGAEAQVLSVTAPPVGSGRATQGSPRRTMVSDTSQLPVVDEPSTKKRRIYLATPDTTGTKRAHGMIVSYQGDTVTPVHGHPDAESLFVFLDHPAVVLVNGQEIVVNGGQAVFWGLGEDHGLRSATAQGLSFLEFHIPGTYGVVRRPEPVATVAGAVA